MTIKKSLEIRLDIVNSQIELYKKNAIKEIEKEEIIPATGDLLMLRDLKKRQGLIKKLLGIGEDKTMSYDIALYRKGLKNNKRAYYNYEGNITYNVCEMLEVAFGEEHLKKWNGLSCDRFFKDLEKGYIDMIKRPKKYKQYDSPNGWGTYETTLSAIKKLYESIQRYAEIDGIENVFLEFI